jgi:prepilin-type N-terminal cleavage/methylation domain-containing protein
MSGADQRERPAVRRTRDQSGITMIELLAAIVIAGIISGMLFTSYFALSNSFSYSVNSDRARDLGRQTMSRMEREIRDAETFVLPTPPGFVNWADQGIDITTEPVVIRSRPYTIVYTTTFNETGNADPTKKPHLVMYRLYYNRTTNKAELWRFEDLPNAAGNYQGRIDNVRMYSGDEPTINGRPNFNDAEKTTGEGHSLVLPVPVFTYGGYLDSDGTMDWSSDVRTADQRVKIIAVQIHLLIDLNPRHSPVYIDLMSTAQLRNQRRF